MIYAIRECYDVPIKGSDKSYQDESEEVYKYLIMAISPVDEEQVPNSYKQPLSHDEWMEVVLVESPMIFARRFAKVIGLLL
jgi:hypothetical protein